MLTDIVVLTDFAYIEGGASKVALNSAEAIAKSGLNVTVFSAVTSPAPPPEGVRLVHTSQHDVASDPNRIRAAQQGLWNFQSAREMEKVLKTLDPARTIVHLHTWTKALSSSPIWVAIRRGFKVVCTLHDYFSACPNGGFFNYQSGSICPFSPLSLSCLKSHCDSRNYSQKLWRVGRQIIQREVAGIPKMIREFIAVSDFSRRVLQPYLPPDAHIHHVENPISVRRREPAEVAVNQPFVMVGRLSQEKGPYLFANAATRLGINGILVGDGPCAEELKEQYPSLTYSGWCSEDEVTQALRSARCLVFPSIWYETQGLVVLEAAASGVPALVPDTSAARDLIIDGQTGLLFKGGDLFDLQEKMRRIQEDPVLAARLGRAAYERFWDNPPTLERHVKELLTVYQRVLVA